MNPSSVVMKSINGLLYDIPFRFTLKMCCIFLLKIERYIKYIIKNILYYYVLLTIYYVFKIYKISQLKIILITCIFIKIRNKSIDIFAYSSIFLSFQPNEKKDYTKSQIKGQSENIFFC